MHYSEDDIVLQLQLGEDSRWEFKLIEFAENRPRKPSRNDLADEIAAFANADGGVLLCGVTDAGHVQGMLREQIVELDSLLVETSTDSIRPPIRIRTSHRQLADGKLLLLVDVPEGESQHDSPGGSYVRVGGSKRKMTIDERLHLAQRRGQARFRSFDEHTVPDTGFKTLDESLWRPLLSAEGAANPESSLEKLALLATDEAGIPRCTVAGVLLCTRNPENWLPGACITATLYRGSDRASGQIDAQVIAGPLKRQIAAAADFARKNMRVAARKDPARADLPQYSERALFEALVNAVVHRDYSIRGSRIRLSMFEDRLEIQSPGSLPNNLTVESMETRQATRNEALTSLMGRMPVEGVRGSEDRRYFMGASRGRRSNHPSRDPGTLRNTAAISTDRWIGGLSHHPRGIAGAEPGSCRHHRTGLNSTVAGGRTASSVSEQDLEASDDGPRRGGERRPACDSSAHDRVRCNSRSCCGSGARLGAEPGSARCRARGTTGRRGHHLLRGDWLRSRAQGQAESDS